MNTRIASQALRISYRYFLVSGCIDLAPILLNGFQEIRIGDRLDLYKDAEPVSGVLPSVIGSEVSG
jgi:hypothetical protein